MSKNKIQLTWNAEATVTEELADISVSYTHFAPQKTGQRSNHQEEGEAILELNRKEIIALAKAMNIKAEELK